MEFADRIRTLHEQSKLPQRKIAAALDIDTATYCRIEHGIRIPSREQVYQLAELLHIDRSDLIILWLSSKITKVLADDTDLVKDVLYRVAKELNVKK